MRRPWVILMLLMIFCMGAKLDKRAYLLATRVVFIQNVYLTTYGKRLPCSRAQEIVGWCQDAGSLHGLSVDWLLALAARERGFLNTVKARPGDGAGYMQMTVDRARMLDPRLRKMTDTQVESYLILNPYDNFRLAAQFLAELKKTSGSWRDAVCKYNVGPNGNLDGKAARNHWAAVDGYHRALVSAYN